MEDLFKAGGISKAFLLAFNTTVFLLATFIEYVSLFLSKNR